MCLSVALVEGATASEAVAEVAVSEICTPLKSPSARTPLWKLGASVWPAAETNRKAWDMAGDYTECMRSKRRNMPSHQRRVFLCCLSDGRLNPQTKLQLAANESHHIPFRQVQVLFLLA